jgi:peroxiredoxin
MNKTQEIFLACILLIASYFAGSSIASLFVVLPTANLAPQEINFTLKDETGLNRSLNDIQSNKPAFVYIFAGDCNHCIGLLRTINNSILPKVKEDKFCIIGVDALGPHGTQEQLVEIRDTFNLPSPILADKDDKVCKSLGIGEFTVLLVNPDGMLTYRKTIRETSWPQDTLPNESLVEAKVSNKSMENSSESSEKLNEFSATILKANESLFRPIQFSLLLLVLIFMAVVIYRSQDSYLAPLSAVGLLLMAVISKAWLFLPLNLFIIILAAFLLVNKKWALLPSLLLGLFVYGLLLVPLFQTKLPSVLYQEAAYGFLPQTILSLLMFYLSFVLAAQKHQKLVFDVQLIDQRSENYSGNMAIKKTSTAERCDVCHQTDLFDKQTGFCNRCHQYTI